jgi:hypothetical protein
MQIAPQQRPHNIMIVLILANFAIYDKLADRIWEIAALTIQSPLYNIITTLRHQ